MDEEEDDLDIIDNDDKDNQSIFKQFPNTKMQEEKNKDSEEIQEPNEISIPRDNTENNLKTIQIKLKNPIQIPTSGG